MAKANGQTMSPETKAPDSNQGLKVSDINKTSRLLTKADILAFQDIPTELVEVPEWNGAVLVRGMTGLQRDAYEAAMFQRDGKDFELDMFNHRARIVAFCIVDEEHNRLFSDDEMMVLGQKSAAALDRVATVAQRLSGMTKADVEDTAKNSPPTTSGDSSSG